MSSGGVLVVSVDGGRVEGCMMVVEDGDLECGCVGCEWVGGVYVVRVCGVVSVGVVRVGVCMCMVVCVLG